MSPATSFPTGPLAGVRVVEFGAIGPVPFASMMLSDMGADVVRLVRPNAAPPSDSDVELRGRRAVAADLKDSADLERVRQLCAGAEIVLEGFRPGVMERLGLGPDELFAQNKRLVFGRMTGWGQDGPLALTAGHDINYIAITGALAAIGTAQEPVAPLNLLGDYGGGAVFLLAGVLAALLNARQSGLGQVVDAAMCDGVLSLLTLCHARVQTGKWNERRQSNMTDGGAHFYGSYECSDGGFMAVGPIEPQFYAEFRRVLGLTDPIFDAQNDRAVWPKLKKRLQEVFLTRSRDEWAANFQGLDACVSPVLGLKEATSDPHLVARNCFVSPGTVLHPAPAPRFSASPSVARPVDPRVHDLGALLREWR